MFTFIYSEDSYGNVKRINFSEHHRDSKFPVSIERVHIWYDAIEKFVKIAYNEKIISTFKMKPGIYLSYCLSILYYVNQHIII